ncbi:MULTISPECIES: cell division protein FtsL [Bacillaceae]|uniref:Cell division protein FtsL n=1 Tax=Oceanobacillus caeni TaxID=405946 RepID=A0ABR5MLZ5_9BACI|nr:MULTISPECIES: cell division protein FtsL [Bacillaceae]KPH77186.1 cell division protein FtsL [Oceanobacillus caeni]
MSANHARNWQQFSPQQTPNKEPKAHVKVQKKNWITKGEKVIYSIVILCFIVSGIFMVSFSSATDSLNRELIALEQTVKHQKVTNEGLVFEKKELSRPERILKIAKEKGLKIQDADVKQAQALNN